ncbi:MAG: hypothetical protein OJF50_006384 [Nitrospira sp.]|nr:hypothetical protein [Nitrospira sp.]
MDKKEKHRDLKAILASLFCLSLVIRAVALWLFPVEHLSTNAEIAYLGGARMILDGTGIMYTKYPIFTPPLYAILIALGTATFGDELLPIKLLQIIADSGTTCVVFIIAREILGQRIALLTGFFLAFYPFSIYAALYIGSETLFTFFLSLFVLFLLRAVSFYSVHWYLLAGFSLGIATLIRGTTQFFLVVVPVALFLTCRTLNKRILLGYLLMCFAFVLCIAPWAVRNYVVLKAVVPVATASSVFLQGSNEKFLTIEGKITWFPIYFAELEKRGIPMPAPGAGPVAFDKYMFKAGLENYLIRAESDPFSFITFFAEKFARLWFSTESGRNHLIILVLNAPFYLFALIGLIFLWRKQSMHRSVWIVIVLVGYFILLHWISLPLFRYVLPVMPYIIAFASAGILLSFERFINRPSRA